MAASLGVLSVDWMEDSKAVHLAVSSVASTESKWADEKVAVSAVLTVDSMGVVTVVDWVGLMADTTAATRVVPRVVLKVVSWAKMKGFVFVRTV